MKKSRQKILFRIPNLREPFDVFKAALNCVVKTLLHRPNRTRNRKMVGEMSHPLYTQYAARKKLKLMIFSFLSTSRRTETE